MVKIGSTVTTPKFSLGITNLADWIPNAKITNKTPWLVKGFIPSDGIVLVSGQQKKARKTYFAMSIGIGIATGCHPSLEICDTGTVLGIFEEGRDAPTADRFEKLCEVHGVSIPSNFHIAWRPRLKLNNKDHKKILLEQIDKLKPKVVILDPLYRMIDGDENKQEDVNGVVETIFEIRSRNIVVILLVHLDKSRGEMASKDIDHQLRGSSLIPNMYDVHVALRKYKAKTKHIDVIVRDREGPEYSYMMRWGDDATFKMTLIDDEE